MWGYNGLPAPPAPRHFPTWDNLKSILSFRVPFGVDWSMSWDCFTAQLAQPLPPSFPFLKRSSQEHSLKNFLDTNLRCGICFPAHHPVTLSSGFPSQNKSPKSSQWQPVSFPPHHQPFWLHLLYSPPCSGLISFSLDTLSILSTPKPLHLLFWLLGMHFPQMPSCLNPHFLDVSVQISLYQKVFPDHSI